MSKKKTKAAQAIPRNYKFRKGFRAAAGFDSQSAGEALDALRNREGCLRTEDVVDEARPEDAPLHPGFEWDDEAAAEEYRKSQARHIIRAIVIVRDVEQTDGKTIQRSIPLYVHVPAAPEEPGHYQDIELLQEDADKWTAALEELMAKRDALETAILELHEIAKTAKHPDRLERTAAAMEGLRMCHDALKDLQWREAA